MSPPEDRLLKHDGSAGFVEAEKFEVSDSAEALDVMRRRRRSWTTLVLINFLVLAVGCVLWFPYRGSATMKNRSEVPQSRL